MTCSFASASETPPPIWSLFSLFLNSKMFPLPAHEEKGCLLGHDIVNDTLNALLVLLQNLGTDSALNRGLDLGMSCNVFFHTEPTEREEKKQGGERYG